MSVQEVVHCLLEGTFRYRRGSITRSRIPGARESRLMTMLARIVEMVKERFADEVVEIMARGEFVGL